MLSPQHHRHLHLGHYRTTNDGQLCAVGDFIDWYLELDSSLCANPGPSRDPHTQRQMPNFML